MEDKNKMIEDILTRGVEDIFIKEHLEERLRSGDVLRIKLGIDPTSPYIHLGRAITLRKLKAFQELGHQIILIIGDFTAKIGDPSDKLEKRPSLTDEQIKNNLERYLEQIALILDMKKVEVRYNSEWLAGMSIPELARLLECFTVQQMSKRRNFKDRLDAGQDVFMDEFLYPALQGYDSVVVKSDVEIGGFDQLFNLKAGRTVQKRYGQKEQDIITLSMLEGTDGRKMSSSWGNIISIIDAPDEMFGKIMSLKDDLIVKYFLLTTGLSMEEIDKIDASIKSGENPMTSKKRLAKEIISTYHSSEEADKAEEDFANKFQKGQIPTEIETISVAESKNIPDALVSGKIVSSKTDFRRLLEAGAITNLDKDQKMKEIGDFVSGSYRIGAHRFVKLEIKD